MNMQATLSPADLSIPRARGIVIGFWIATALFCLQIGCTAYAQLRLPVVAEAFAHRGFPDDFRVELAPISGCVQAAPRRFCGVAMKPAFELPSRPSDLARQLFDPHPCLGGGAIA